MVRAQWLEVILILTLQLLTSGVTTLAKEPAKQSHRQQVELVLFWEPGCPYCRRAKQFLENQPETRTWLRITAIDVSSSPVAQAKFLHTNEFFSIERPGVPLIVIGGRHFIGFDDAEGMGRVIMEAARACRLQTCATLDQLLANQTSNSGNSSTANQPYTIDLPFVGLVNIADLSLPALTIVLAAIDGFNPCAMWVLVFLVGLLIGVQDRVRMWLLGGAFLLTSGIVYFGFLAAWLNVFLFIGALLWVRVVVGLIAIGSGTYYLYAFATDAAAQCKVTNPTQRQQIMTALRASVNEKRFLAAVAGIVILAAAVNLIELICSAGIPAVFTDVLAMNNLPIWEYYAYLLLYVSVFMIDDIAIFVIAMVTLHATSMTNQFLRFSHLIGGVGMLVIGSLLLFAPQWLTFQA